MKSKSFIIAVVVIISGCSGVLGPGNDKPGPNESQTTPSVETPLDTTPPYNTSEMPRMSPQERESINSTREFGEHLEDGLSHHNHTEYISSTPTSNNSLHLTLQTDGDVPLEHSVMDGVQIIGEVVFHTTIAADDPPRRENGTLQLLHRPQRVSVSLRGPRHEQLGSFEVNPAMVHAYRLDERQPTELAEAVMDSYESTQKYKRGQLAPSDYLNRSELDLWVRDYRDEVRLSSEQNDFNLQIPSEKIHIKPSTNEVSHYFAWNTSKFDQNYISAKRTVYGSYWRTADDSFALAPEKLNVRIQLPENGDDFVGTMNRSTVWWFLGTDRGNEAREIFFDQEKYRFVDEDKEPFENLSRSSATPTGRLAPSNRVKSNHTSS